MIMTHRGLLRVLAVFLAVLFTLPAYAAGDPLELRAVGEDFIAVYSSEEEIAFEVEVLNGSDEVRFQWFQCDQDGNASGGEIGFGGKAYVVRGIPNELMGEVLYYKCVATLYGEVAEHIFSCVLYPMGVEEEGMTLYAVSDQDIVINDPEEEIAFEVGAENAVGALQWTEWYRCDEHGAITGDDIGFGGTAYVVRGIPEEYAGERFYYACIVRDSGGNEGLFVFSCMLDLSIPEEDDEAVVGITVTSVPTKTTYRVGDLIDLTGLVVRIYTRNGFMDKMDGDGVAVDPELFRDPGEQEVLVACEGFLDTFTVTVTAAEDTTAASVETEPISAESDPPAAETETAPVETEPAPVETETSAPETEPPATETDLPVSDTVPLITSDDTMYAVSEFSDILQETAKETAEKLKAILIPVGIGVGAVAVVGVTLAVVLRKKKH